MDPGSAILRVKRKRRTDPADALLLACKRVRADSGTPQPEPEHARIESSVFKLVATVASQDAPVQTHVREALSRPRLAHALRPSRSSSSRIIGDLRNTKWSTRRDERYRILSSHRAGLLAEPQKKTDVKESARAAVEPLLGDIQVFDIVQEDGEEDERDQEESSESTPETILCNSVKMMREKLSVSTHTTGAEHREKENEYVYDLYYQETATPGWIQDILSSNWRNDYPDEEEEEEGESEEENNQRYGGSGSST
ncbi:putative RNA polymerase II nuclear localization protein SLC7A6OS [Bagarius yarrelli]|uniref:Putative RNA polymerase II nuclear localization protein SLC7A6OS n=1 Tax=Bagarius yarrelli TaxID=175774 RepID=A0A556VD36_BAGYA|nr:putative RNA polymerase II nuclear localization protein SLC7A6OS [Bagarius yarrelli]